MPEAVSSRKKQNGKAAIIKKVVARLSLIYRRVATFPFCCALLYCSWVILSLLRKTSRWPQSFDCRSSALRLSVWLMMMVICSPLRSISVSVLHLGQYRGKCFSSVSPRICTRVLFPQCGHKTHFIFIVFFQSFLTWTSFWKFPVDQVFPKQIIWCGYLSSILTINSLDLISAETFPPSWFTNNFTTASPIPVLPLLLDLSPV